jgi:hypothetical protein
MVNPHLFCLKCGREAQDNPEHYSCACGQYARKDIPYAPPRFEWREVVLVVREQPAEKIKTGEGRGMLESLTGIMSDVQNSSTSPLKGDEVDEGTGGSEKSQPAPHFQASHSAKTSATRATVGVPEGISAPEHNRAAPGLSQSKPKKGEATKPASTPISTGRVGRPPNPESEKKVCGNCGLRKAWRRGLCRVCFTDDAPRVRGRR